MLIHTKSQNIKYNIQRDQEFKIKENDKDKNRDSS